MLNKDNNWRLPLNLEEQTGIELGNHIYFPLYFGEYKEGIKNIFKRVYRAEADEDKSKEFLYITGKGNNNILSFIGERGSGKTTAMREFCQILQKMNKKEEIKWWGEQFQSEDELYSQICNKKFAFDILETIDVSTLEAKEDLFELVIAAIYKKYYNYKKQQKESFYFKEQSRTEILELFEKIIDGYHAIKNSRNEDFGDSYISRLKSMSSSMDIKRYIDELIDKLVGEWSEYGSNTFLVIAIDDLDLNINHGYEMLEQLHKYFLHPNVLIILTVDYEQINAICETHYFKEFTEEKVRSDELNKEMWERSRELSQDYITKVLPVDARIYMPDMKTLTKKVIIDLEDKKRTPSVKEYIEDKIVEKLGIFYDMSGLKRHFCEPDTIRELVNYNGLLDSLYQIDYSQWNSKKLTVDKRKEIMQIYDRNHERFNRDIYNRLAYKLLDSEGRKQFEKIIKSDLERRAMQVCRLAWESANGKEKGIDNKILVKYKRYNEKSDERKYSYGDFLDVIYNWGRDFEEDKPLIKCLIASFTSEMVRENFSYLRNPNEAARQRSYKRLQKFLGKSFGSQWTEGLIPRLFDRWECGYAERVDLSRINIRFRINSSELFGHINLFDTDLSKQLEKFWNWLEKEKIISTIEVLLMFFTSVRIEGLNLYTQIQRDSTDVQFREYLFIKGGYCPAHWDIMGVVEKTLGYKQKYMKNWEMISEMLTDLILENVLIQSSEKSRIKEAVKKEMKNKVQELSIHTKIKWDNQGSTVFPFYDFDLAYNVMKRVKQTHENENPYSMIAKDCYGYIRKVYSEIAWQLQAENRGSVRYYYYEDYISCPFIKAFQNADAYLNPEFPRFLGETIYQVLRPGSIDKQDKPEG